MDFFGIDITIIVPIFVGLAIASIIILVYYHVLLKPRLAQPLPNERPLGYLQTWFPKGYGPQSGNWCTARKTLEREITRLLENETDSEKKQDLEKAYKIFDSYYPYAQKVGRQTKILLFDDNPEDQKYLDVNPNENDSFILHGVQDVVSVGEYSGIEYLALKLDSETKQFTKDEKELASIGLGIVEYLRDAAKNVEKIHNLNEEIKFQKECYDKVWKQNGELRSENDGLKGAASIRPLTQEEGPKVKPTLVEKLKPWFKSYQLLTAIAGYLIAPWILTYSNVYLEYPLTTYFAAFMSVVGFFIIPIIRKIFGRWL